MRVNIVVMVLMPRCHSWYRMRSKFGSLDQVAKLDSAIKSNDPKILQMELQGSIGTTVNQVTACSEMLTIFAFCRVLSRLLGCSCKSSLRAKCQANMKTSWDFASRCHKISDFWNFYLLYHIVPGPFKEVWRCPKKKPAVYQEGPGGLPEPAGEELPHMHGVPQATSQVKLVMEKWKPCLRHVFFCSPAPCPANQGSAPATRCPTVACIVFKTLYSRQQGGSPSRKSLADMTSPMV